MKIDLGADILPGEALGGIPIGEDFDAVAQQLQAMGVPFTESGFSNVGRSFRLMVIDGGTVSAVAEPPGGVSAIWCTESYRGSYRGVLRPGMTVRNVMACTNQQLVIHGFLVLDKHFGMAFNLPEKYDDEYLDDVSSANDLPSEMKLEELHVMPVDWWR